MGKIDEYYKQFEKCRQKEEPACTNICPFHLNVLDFQDKMQRHKYDRAYRDFKNAVCFPEIVASLCPEFCKEACPRKDFDGAVQLNLLEKTCVAKAKRKDPTLYNLPKKEGKIGIIGAGASGLACALKLLEKKYEVIVFEKENRIGGQLHGLLSSEIVKRDIELQFSKEKFTFITDTEISVLDEIKKYEFNAVYVATGKDGNDFGMISLSSEDNYCIIKDGIAVFTGGSILGKDAITSIADGIDIAWAIEVFLKTGNLEYPKPHPVSLVVPNTDKFLPCDPVSHSSESKVLTDDEIEREAARCIRCQCDACRTQCDLVAFNDKGHDKWPIAIKEDIAMTVVSSESMIHKTPGIRIINTCTQCGLFEESCPESIEMGNLILESRKLLHKQDKMPPAFHGFWLDDMEHANSECSKICENHPHETSSKYAYFPGCHLGALNPSYVQKSYEWLLANFDSMGLLLRCCGIPADWAGNEEMHLEQISNLKTDWEALGKPVLVTACPSCTKHISDYLPEIKTKSIYELMQEHNNLPSLASINALTEREYSIFDPCAARNDIVLQNSVREALKNYNVSDLPNAPRYGCCGFGGNVEVANPEFAEYVAKERSSLSENPYITYCINCKEVFMHEEKEVLHILDILFDIENSEKLPNLTERRENRVLLKNRILGDIYNKEMKREEEQYSIAIAIPNELRIKMDALKLVDDDIKQVIIKSKNLNRRIYNREKDEYICYSKLNYITCWVAYKTIDDIYKITNIYTHRMDIELEDIWNGRKVKTDM